MRCQELQMTHDPSRLGSVRGQCEVLADTTTVRMFWRIRTPSVRISLLEATACVLKSLIVGQIMQR